MTSREPSKMRRDEQDAAPGAPAGGAGGAHSAEKLLQNVLLLQHQAVRAMAAEMHQQTEVFVQQHGWHPLTRRPTAAAHEAKLTLRAAAQGADTDANLLSEALVQLTRAHCDARGCVTSPEQLARFLKAAKSELQTLEDRLQALFLLDTTLHRAHRSLARKKKTRARAEALLGRFEAEQGFELLVEWFAASCSYKDDAHRGFTDVLLRTMLRNPPTRAFARKTLLSKLKSYPRFVSGKPNKELLERLLAQCREANAHA